MHHLLSDDIDGTIEINIIVDFQWNFVWYLPAPVADVACLDGPGLFASSSRLDHRYQYP